MTDIHMHVIPGVDDGAGNPETSREMLRRAASQGVAGIVCTSHWRPGLRPFPMDAYQRGLEELRRFSEEEKLGITLYSGSEVLYTVSGAEAIQKGAYMTLGEGKTVLTEFVPDAPWDTILHAVRDFRDAGLRMAAAHVERYGCLRKDLSRLAKLREYGALLQMNAGTVLRCAHLFGDSWAKKALKAGLIDIVASDAHDLASRAPNLGPARTALVRICGAAATGRMLEETPRGILG